MKIKPISLSFILVTILSRAGFSSESVTVQQSFDAETAKIVLQALIESQSKSGAKILILKDVLNGKIFLESLTFEEMQQLSKDLDAISFQMSLERGSII